MFGDIRAAKDSISKKIEELDHLEEEGVINDIQRLERKELRKNLEEVILKEEILWAQKAGVQWLKEGDSNTRFFHWVANGSRKERQLTSWNG